MPRGDGLDAYARAFADAGANALAFDYRYLGDSGGQPRQRFRIAEQQEDLRNAILFVREQRGVDPARIVLWGFSFSGGNIAALLGSQKVDVAAALLLCPMVDGLARVKATPVSILLWLLPHVLADMAGRHNTVPITGPPGSHAAMTLAGEAEGFAAARTPESKWRNEISPGVLVTLPLFRPFRRADRIRIPIWVGRCADDISSHGASIGKLASRAPQATLDDMPGDHFAPFQGVGITRAVESQIAFLRSCGLLPTAAAAGS